jgi:hypothetical protein
MILIVFYQDFDGLLNAHARQQSKNLDILSLRLRIELFINYGKNKKADNIKI